MRETLKARLYCILSGGRGFALFLVFDLLASRSISSIRYIQFRNCNDQHVLLVKPVMEIGFTFVVVLLNLLHVLFSSCIFCLCAVVGDTHTTQCVILQSVQ